MAHQNDHPITYPELLNFYFDYGFPELLGGNCNSLAQAIMQKWNRLYRPNTFRMSNKEAGRLAGLNGHIGRTRDRLVKECVIEEQPLFSYKSRGQKMAGTYKINTAIIPDKYRINTMKLPNNSQPPTIKIPDSDHNGNDPKGKESKENKENFIEEGNKDEEKFKWVCNLFQKAAPGWSPVNDYVLDKVKYICEFPDGHIEAVFHKARENNIHRNGLLQYVLKGLDNYASLYKGKGRKPQAPKPVDEIKRLKKCLEDFKADPNYVEGREWEVEYTTRLQTQIKELEAELNAEST